MMNEELGNNSKKYFFKDVLDEILEKIYKHNKFSIKNL